MRYFRTIAGEDEPEEFKYGSPRGGPVPRPPPRPRQEEEVPPPPPRRPLAKTYEEIQADNQRAEDLRAQRELEREVRIRNLPEIPGYSAEEIEEATKRIEELIGRAQEPPPPPPPQQPPPEPELVYEIVGFEDEPFIGQEPEPEPERPLRIFNLSFDEEGNPIREPSLSYAEILEEQAEAERNRVAEALQEEAKKFNLVVGAPSAPPAPPPPPPPAPPRDPLESLKGRKKKPSPASADEKEEEVKEVLTDDIAGGIQVFLDGFVDMTKGVNKPVPKELQDDYTGRKVTINANYGKAVDKINRAIRETVRVMQGLLKEKSFKRSQEKNQRSKVRNAILMGPGKTLTELFKNLKKAYPNIDEEIIQKSLSTIVAIYVAGNEQLKDSPFFELITSSLILYIT